MAGAPKFKDRLLARVKRSKKSGRAVAPPKPKSKRLPRGAFGPAVAAQYATRDALKKTRPMFDAACVLAGIASDAQKTRTKAEHKRRLEGKTDAA